MPRLAMIGHGLSRSVHATTSPRHVCGFPKQGDARVIEVPVDRDAVFGERVLLLYLAQLGGKLLQRARDTGMFVQHPDRKRDRRHIVVVWHRLARQTIEPPLDSPSEL